MKTPLLLLSLGLFAGCAGNVADYVGPRSSIVTPQLMRYGLNLREVGCVGEQLGTSLRPLQLRRLVRAAATVRQGYFDPDRLTARDLLYVASRMEDGRVAFELGRANSACGVRTEAAAADASAAPAAAETGAPAAAAAPRPAWLNLGSAGSGQAIAVDASTIEQDAGSRTAWFRMIDPGAAGPSASSYRLRIDCARRTITPLAHRRMDAAGAVADYREYAPGPESPTTPVEAGTVTEIAYLSLCT